MQQVKEENLFKYSKREDQLNYITHAIGAVFALIGGIYLLVSHNDVSNLVKLGIIIYMISMIALFMASSLYHKEQEPSKRAVLKRLDHSMILVMISGTYAPFCLVMNTTSSLIVLFLVYFFSVIGILLKIKYINVHKGISILIYLIVGWLALFMIKDIISVFDPIVITLMIAGGVTYSFGALVYAFTSFEYHHALWHVFVLVAAIMFFFAVNYAL